ncbi:proline iminopeptidase-family hydrolase [Penaeicola halotolerans]|uniref:proline iminopeptidase-family hydrolase n=1 Tax=Penaeicola halotolerans TaxID=2793196 RepID=UPI001CF916BC|nr:proline iminopeptidase-family hydrolase [Penaeicola halotolerans]
MKKWISLLSLSLIFACSSPAPESQEAATDTWTQEEKYIEIEANGGKYKVWTQRNGDNPTKRLLLLHGGPGNTHEYFRSFEEYFPEENIEFIYYDQLGSGKSDNPADTTFWNIPRFVAEVEQVRQALKLDQDNFYLLGHSWGGILALEYALQHQDKMKGLIISNMMASCIDYGKYAEEVLAPQFDQAVLQEVRAIEADADFDNPRYMELLMEHYYPKHVLRIPVDEWPEPVMNSLSNVNSQLYVYMQGPSEFGIGGTLAQWDRKADLPKITIPTLTIGGAHDTMDPKHMEWMSTQVQNGTYLHCPDGSHMAMWDDADTYHRGIIDFIKKTDQ